MGNTVPGVPTPAIGQIRAAVNSVRETSAEGPYTEVEVAITGGPLIVAYEGAYAEAARKSLHEGDMLQAEGELVVQDWQTKRSGKRSRVILKARTLRIIPSPRRTPLSVP